MNPGFNTDAFSPYKKAQLSDTSDEYEEEEEDDDDPDFTYHNNIKSTITPAIKRLDLLKGVQKKKNTQVQVKNQKKK
jgi:hypothetical protein